MLKLQRNLLPPYSLKMEAAYFLKQLVRTYQAACHNLMWLSMDVTPQTLYLLARTQFHPSHQLHIICSHSLTPRPKSLTQEQVRCRAVSIVPHEGVCESLVAWRQVVNPTQFHAVLLAVTIVIWLAVELVMLRPAGEPVCRQEVAGSGGCHTGSLFCIDLFGKKWPVLILWQKKLPVLTP